MVQKSYRGRTRGKEPNVESTPHRVKEGRAPSSGGRISACPPCGIVFRDSKDFPETADPRTYDHFSAPSFWKSPAPLWFPQIPRLLEQPVGLGHLGDPVWLGGVGLVLPRPRQSLGAGLPGPGAGPLVGHALAAGAPAFPGGPWGAVRVARRQQR